MPRPTHFSPEKIARATRSICSRFDIVRTNKLAIPKPGIASYDRNEIHQNSEVKHALHLMLRCLASLLWKVARYTSGEAVTSQSMLYRQSTFATPPQSFRLTLRKRKEAFCFSPLESREVHERRGRDKSIDTASSIGFSNASPVLPTDPPQAEGNMMFLSSGESRVMRAERP